MPLSDSRKPEIVTIPIVSATNSFLYTFNLNLPTSPLFRGATQVQILWVQIIWAASAAVGVRVPIIEFQNPSATVIYGTPSIATQTAGQVIGHTWMQGILVFPVGITGILRSIPVNGLTLFNNFVFRMADLSNISAADTITGNMQVRLY